MIFVRSQRKRSARPALSPGRTILSGDKEPRRKGMTRGADRHRRCLDVHACHTPRRPGLLPGMVPGRKTVRVARILSGDRTGQLLRVAPGSHPGIHFASVPPGQAKYVTCVSGAVLDVVVDIRVGSPSYGRWEAVRLDEESRRAVFLSEGLGHAFTALSDEATVI